MAAPKPITLYVKANLDDPTKLGDCPFCQRVFLTFKLKKIPTKVELINFHEKPEWLIRVNDGKVPVIQETEGGEYLPDSDAIVARLDEIAPEPSIKQKAPAGLGAKLWPSFRSFILTSTPESQEALLGELRALEKYLSENTDKGAFFGGASLDALDAALAPKLYHVKVALLAIRKWSLPEEFVLLRQYLEALKALPEWQETDYGEAAIVSGWKRHVAMDAAGKH